MGDATCGKRERAVGTTTHCRGESTAEDATRSNQENAMGNATHGDEESAEESAVGDAICG